MDEWLSLYKGGNGEIIEKKSRFIASIEVVKSQEEASEFINSIKKKYWDAKHNCSAFVIGDDGEMTRCSDDGEPSGTAGRPMLEVLKGEKITNICVVVTRYFGGVLLGTGGLVRAYQAAVKEGLANCSVLKRIKGYALKVSCDYSDLAKIQFLCKQNDYYLGEIDYGQNVVMQIIIPIESFDALSASLMDATSARAGIDDKQDIVYAMIDGKPEVFAE